MPLLLPPALVGHRAAIVAALAAAGVGGGHYFSPHIGEQPLFRDVAVIEPTPVADDVAARMLSLPITDAMTPADATEIAHRLVRAIERVVDAEMARMLVPHGTEHAVAQWRRARGMT